MDTPNLFKGMSVLLWNVRGISRPSFGPNFRLLMHHHSPSLVVLVETWVSRERTEVIVGGLGMDSWFLVDPVGFAGGILLLWNLHIINFQKLGEGTQGVHGVVEVRAFNKSFILSAIYASPKFHSRKLLWSDLLSFSVNINKPWLVVGDFNEVKNKSEKQGGRNISVHRSNLYVDTMNNCNLIDLGFNGPKYTWTNNRSGNPIYERLDRAWANSNWIESFPDHNLWHLPRVTSDHCPILLKLENPRPMDGPKPFRFEPMWILHDNYPEVVRRAWTTRETPVGEKINHVRETLIDWNHNCVGNVHARKRHLLARLKGVQLYLQNRPSSSFHQNLERDLQMEIMQTLDQEELLWRSKSRMDRIGGGRQEYELFPPKRYH